MPTESVAMPGLRTALADHAPVFATFSMMTTPLVAEIIGVCGFDAVILDLEHSTHTRQSLEAGIVAATARGIRPLVRVPDGRPSTIQAVLDLGPHGIIVPQVASAEQAAAAVSASRFPPDGTRGVNPWVRAASFGIENSDYLRAANEQIAVMVMIEGADAIEAAGEIMAVPGLDAVFVGPVDLAASLGVPGQTRHPKVLDAMQMVVARGAELGVAVAAFAPQVDGARELADIGVRFIACAEDTQVLAAAYREIVERFRR